MYVFSKILNTALKYFLAFWKKKNQKTDFRSDSNTEIEYLFKEMENHLSNNIAEDPAEYKASFNYKDLSRTMEREILSLTRAFTKVQNPDIRKIIIELVRSVVQWAIKILV